MTALAAPRLLLQDMEQPGKANIATPLAASVTIWAGAAMLLDPATGLAHPAQAGVGAKTWKNIGVARKMRYPLNLDPSGALKVNGAGDAGKFYVETAPGVFGFIMGGALDATDVGKLAYWLDDQTVTDTAANATAGKILRVEGTLAFIDIRYDFAEPLAP